MIKSNNVFTKATLSVVTNFLSLQLQILGKLNVCIIKKTMTMAQQKIVMPLKKLAFPSSTSVAFKKSSRSSKYLRILAHAPRSTTFKTGYFNNYGLKGLPADIFTELAN